MSVGDYVSDDAGFAFESNVGDAEDYYFMYSGSLDGVVGAMRHLTGSVPLNAPIGTRRRRRLRSAHAREAIPGCSRPAVSA